MEWNKKLYRIQPLPDPLYYSGLASIYNILGRYDDAIEAIKKALNMDPPLMNRIFCNIEVAKSYALSGREKEARDAAAYILTYLPMTTAEYHVKTWGYMPEDEKRFIDALLRAGLPLKAPENMRFWEEL